jgi:hypothetical protein
MTGEVHKCSDYECYTLLSEPFNSTICYKHIFLVNLLLYVYDLLVKGYEEIKFISFVVTPSASCLRGSVFRSGCPDWTLDFHGFWEFLQTNSEIVD